MKRMLSNPVMLPEKPPPNPSGHEQVIDNQRALPAVGSTTPPNILMSVDLPWPFRPNNASRSPWVRSKDKSRNSVLARPLSGYCFARSRTTSAPVDKVPVLVLLMFTQPRQHQR